MKKTFYSFLLAGLMMLWAVPQLWGQSLSDISVCASATASVANYTGGHVDILQVLPEEQTPDFSSMNVTKQFSVQVNMAKFMEYNSQAVVVSFVAQPTDGYYFKQWNKVETAEFFFDNNHIDSILSNRMQLGANAYWGPFDGDGFKLCDNAIEGQDITQYINYQTQQPCGGKVYTEPQSIGTYEAVFAPIPINSCVGGQVETIYTDEASKNWNITFSTSYARSINDFNAPSFTNPTTTGGAFSLNLNEEVTFDNNVITIPVTFTPANPAKEGSFTADLTISSKGGASLTMQVKAIVEVRPDEGVVATVINGTATPQPCQSFEDALAAVQTGGTLQLRRDINLTDPTQDITKNFTLDLNGKVLSSTVSPLLNIAGGDLTIVDSKMIGQISLTAAADAADDAPAVRVTTGSLTMNRGTIAAKANSATNGAMAVQVLGGTFTLNDGLLQATANNNAAAILNYGGTVIMKAGELQATAATNVATLAAYDGSTTTVENGSITATLTGTNTGAGVYVRSGATVTVQRATVLAQATGGFAGGLFAAYAEGNLTVSKKAELKAVSNNTTDAYALFIGAGSAVTVDGAKLSAADSEGATFELGFPDSALENAHLQAAFFVTDKTKMEEELASAGLTLTVYRVAAGVEYNEGYRSFIGARYENAKANGVSMFRIGNKSYTSLEDALLYAQNNPSEGVTILQVNDYTLPAGYYTLPANATLLVPYDETQLAPRYAAVKRVETKTTPTPYLCLTMSSGSNLDVYGNFEVGGQQKSAAALQEGAGAFVSSSYGWVRMEKGSAMTLEDGATLYAWGYVTGQGEIEARRGATVREFFQIQDWPGAFAAMTRWMKGIFPLNQYFIQNVESPVSYHPGAKLYTSFAATASGITLASDVIQIVGVDGENAIFLMDDKADADNTWVRKWYDVENDKQVYDVNSGAHLGSMVIPLPMLGIMCSQQPFKDALRSIQKTLTGIDAPVYIDGFDSKLFTLPITSNMKIHLLTGSMDITQATQMIPGSEIEVDKGATVTLNGTLTMDDGSSKEVNLYLFDKAEWGEFALNGKANQIEYTPSRPENGNAPADRDLDNLPDAKLNVHGTFKINGKLFTTESGANVFSTNDDAGTIRFEQAMPAAEDVTIKLYEAVGEDILEIPVIPALLQNSEGQTPAYANSAETPAGQSYCFINDRWTVLYNFADMYVKAGFAESVDDINDSTYVYNNYGEWYIKPAAYVAVRTVPTNEFASLAGNPTTRPLENADHTYSDAAGEGRLFIFMNDQWWEVTLENNLYRGTNGTYYYYDEDYEGWKEKQFDINFVNWDGQPVVEPYSLSYGVMPKYNSTNPTRAEDVDYTYTFTGWTPALAPVTGNATYTATYEATQRKYTIVFLNENGTEIERHFLTRDEMPACDNLPTKTGYYLQWSPAIGAVTGNQTYQATFLPEPPTEFTITFKNYDGLVLQTSEKVEIGTKISTLYNDTPTKQATKEFTYTFTGWAPAITDDLRATEDMTFTAQYSEARKQATVIFYKEDSITELSRQAVDYGQFPTVPVYQKDANAEYTYTMGWNPQVSAVSTPDTTYGYKATVTPVKNRYTVTVLATGCSVTGVGTYEYGTQVTLALTANEGFVDARWSDGTPGNKVITVTGDVTYTAAATAQASDNLVIGPRGEETLTAETRKASFVIEADANGAGQLINPEYLSLTAGGNAYYRYIFNATARKWYAFSVPFECNATTAANAAGSTLRLAQDFDILRYNGATRAAHGKDNSAWEYLSDLGVNTLTPGVLYMIRFKAGQTSLTFTKKASASIVYVQPVTLNEYVSAATDDAGWNGIAASKLYTVYLQTGATLGQVYDAAAEGYNPVTIGIDQELFPIGKPVFVQATAALSVVQTAVGVSPVAARRMTKSSQEVEVTLSAVGQKYATRIYVKADEDAEDRYTIGEDLAKMGVSTKVAQMWVNRYGNRLCVNATAPENEVAVFPLTLSAPAAGAYTLSAPRGTGSATLYLMENGQVIANLTEGDYTLDLNKGTTEAYSLRMVLRPRGVVTDLDEAATIEGVQKVIKDGTLYIIRDGKAYTVQGQAVDAE